MEWFVQYQTAGMDQQVGQYSSPEAAIEAACQLIAGGNTVYGIGSDTLGSFIGPEQIDRIYAIWARTLPRPERSTS